MEKCSLISSFSIPFDRSLWNQFGAEILLYNISVWCVGRKWPLLWWQVSRCSLNLSTVNPQRTCLFLIYINDWLNNTHWLRLSGTEYKKHFFLRSLDQIVFSYLAEEVGDQPHLLLLTQAYIYMKEHFIEMQSPFILLSLKPNYSI